MDSREHARYAGYGEEVHLLVNEAIGNALPLEAHAPARSETIPLDAFSAEVEQACSCCYTKSRWDGRHGPVNRHFPLLGRY